MVKLLSKKIFWLISILILGIIFFIGSFFLIKPKVTEIIPPPAQVPLPIEEKPITIILVGDIMLNRGVEYMIKKEGDGDFKFPFLEIAKDLNGADILFGNLEGPISGKGTKVGSIYSFRAEPEAIEGLIHAGFDVISLANNHAFDYGRVALEDCLAKLSNAKISYVGAGLNEIEAFGPVIKEINGSTGSPLRIGFLAYTNLGPESWKATSENLGIARVSEKDMEKVKESIKSAKEKVDILIVSLHAGEEYAAEPTQFQVEFSKAAVDAGADLVVGHHPHVVQKSEKRYKDKWIFYSLGNFVFDQSFSEETMKGEMLEILIEDGKINELIPKKIKLNNYFQPAVDFQ